MIQGGIEMAKLFAAMHESRGEYGERRIMIETTSLAPHG
jgi:hypothetical protein